MLAGGLPEPSRPGTLAHSGCICAWAVGGAGRGVPCYDVSLLVAPYTSRDVLTSLGEQYPTLVHSSSSSAHILVGWIGNMDMQISMMSLFGFSESTLFAGFVPW